MIFVLSGLALEGYRQRTHCNNTMVRAWIHDSDIHEIERSCVTPEVASIFSMMHLQQSAHNFLEVVVTRERVLSTSLFPLIFAALVLSSVSSAGMLPSSSSELSSSCSPFHLLKLSCMMHRDERFRTNRIPRPTLLSCPPARPPTAHQDNRFLFFSCGSNRVHDCGRLCHAFGRLCLPL